MSFPNIVLSDDDGEERRLKLKELIEPDWAEALCSHFQMGKWSGKWERLGGVFNVNVKLTTDQGDYVVKISPLSDHTQQFAEIYRLQWRLADRGIPVALPLESIDGLPYWNFAGKLLQVSPFINGGYFSELQEQVRASGAMLRTFHDALSGIACNLQPKGSFFQPYEYCQAALKKLAGYDKISRFGLSEVRECVERVYGQWEAFNYRLPMTILHGDWHFWNQLYDGDRVCGVLDLDGMVKGPRILDVAYVMWVIHILLPKQADEFRTAFFAGYGKLSCTESVMLPWATAKISLYFLCHSAYSRKPTAKWNKQYANQMPFIRWLLADGERESSDLV